MSNQKTKNQPNQTGSLVAVPELSIISQGENLLISAQLLHKRLRVSTKFSMWFQRRIEKYGFEIGTDCFPNLGSKNYGRGGHNAVDYLLTLDTAKEFAMLEENEIGRQFRRYFIQKEREARGVGIPMLTLQPGAIPTVLHPAEVFKGIRTSKINGRRCYIYKDVLQRIGYSVKSGSLSARRRQHPQHFAQVNDTWFIVEDFARHLLVSKAVVLNRATLRSMQAVIPFENPTQKGGAL